MQPTDNSQAQITAAIGILQDAKNRAFDEKAVRADVVKATNILMGILGLKGVAPDTNTGT